MNIRPPRNSDKGLLTAIFVAAENWFGLRELSKSRHDFVGLNLGSGRHLSSPVAELAKEQPRHVLVVIVGSLKSYRRRRSIRCLVGSPAHSMF